MKAEILAPAGDYESLKTAVMCGADAVYFGLKQFNCRAGAKNFENDELIKAIELCRLFGVRAYIAFNISVKEDELKEAEETIGIIDSAGADAIIATDLAALSLCQKIAPHMPVHISTQAGVHNLYSAKFFERAGADRVVLSRETILQDIAEIKNNTTLEIEAFVHGALCVSFSGGCLLSAVMNGRSGNRGDCMQPCRQKYLLDAGGRKTEGYMLSPSDLCFIKRLKDLTAAGVTSFKIEGRMRRQEYVGQAVISYQKALNGTADLTEEIIALKKVFSRGGFSEGYVFSPHKELMSVKVQNHMGIRAGKVLHTVTRGGYPYATVFSDIEIKKGDGLKILRAGKEVGGADVHSVEKAGKDCYLIPVSLGVAPGDEVYLTTDAAQNAAINAIVKKINIDISVKAKIGLPLSVSAVCKKTEVHEESPYVVQKALSRATSTEEIKEAFLKLGDTPFEMKEWAVDADSGIFIPKGQLNELRRAVLSAVQNKILASYKRAERKNQNNLAMQSFQKAQNKEITVEIRNAKDITAELCRATRVVLRPETYSLQTYKEFQARLRAANVTKVYLALPKIMKGTDAALLSAVDFIKSAGWGIHAEGVFAVQLAREKGLTYGGGIGLNLFNTVSVDAYFDADYLTLSPELTRAEALPLLQKGVSLFAFGYLPVMTLNHCPVKLNTNCDCSSCAYKGVFTYSDNKFSYPAIREKSSFCQFSVYNALPHNLTALVSNEPYNLYINLYGYKGEAFSHALHALISGNAYDIDLSTKGGFSKN